MPDVRRCAIFGCKSNSRERNNMKFFNFPARDNPQYEVWLSICHESEQKIRGIMKPYICSKHFPEKLIGFRRLAVGALPSLHLSAPPGFVQEETARLAALAAKQEERKSLMKLINDCVLEWCLRAQHYPELASICQTRRELRKTGKEVRNLLGATLQISIDDYWLRKFRQSHLRENYYSKWDQYQNKALDLVSIIKELDPNAKILSEKEIEDLREKEKIKMKEAEQSRSVVKVSKLISPDSRKHSSSSSFIHSNNKTYQKEFLDEDNDEISYKTKKSKPDDAGNSSGAPEILFEGCNKRMNPKTFENVLKNYYDDEKGKDKNYIEERIENCSVDLSQEDDDDIGFRSSDDHRGFHGGEPTINSYEQALLHLKPLEDFALRQENYRAIGLLSTLEIIFKNPKFSAKK